MKYYIKGNGIKNLLKKIKLLFNGIKKEIDIYILDTKFPQTERYKNKKLGFLNNNLTIKQLSKFDTTYLKDYVAFRSDIPLSEKFVNGLLDRGGICFLALLNEQIIGATCLAFDEFPLFGFNLDFILTEGQSYNFHMYVEKKFRGRCIAFLLEEQAIHFTLSKGYRYLISAIYPWNKPSYSFAYKIGYKKYAKVYFSQDFFSEKLRFAKISNGNKCLLTLRIFNKQSITV